jgi:serine/threonine protein kinase
MDPVNLLYVAYSLYESIDNNLKTVIKNKEQFILLGRRIQVLAAPIKRLQDIQKSSKKLQGTDEAMKSLVYTLQSIKLFVSQPRFQKPDGDKASNLLHFISQMYHASEDNESFVHFDKLLTNDIQSLNFGITVSIFDYGPAAAKDDETIFKESGLNSRPELRHIDLAKLEWDQNNISDRLGQGAFSVVWKGKYNNQPVAIKQVLNLTTLSQKDIRTITKEALLMQFSDHAHVLKVEGVCLPQGLLVMELALCSLSEYMYRPTTPETAAKAQKVKLARIDSLLSLSDQIKWKLEIILQICDALQYLHRFNILHRDLKSPNVMLFLDTTKNKVIAKIGDFGLALAVDFITRTTAGHMVSKISSTFLPNAVGTYNYMAPELFERQPGERVAYSESSDVYSLGILINEIMSGTMPWGRDARDLDIMNWVLNKSKRPEMWTVSAKPSAAERELFAIVGSSDSAHASCLQQSQQRRPSAYDVYISSIGTNPSTNFPQNVPVVASDSKMSSRAGYQQVRTVEAPILDITDADQSLICDFVGGLLVRFNDISEKNALRYAETLFRLSITTCERLEEQLRAKNKLKRNGAVEWLQTLSFHEYDIADIVEMTTPANSQDEVLKQQGVNVLESWIQTQFPKINVPRNRRQWAQNLWDNNITTVHRLMKYGDDLNFLKSIGIIELDAKDISSYIQAESKRLLEVKYQWTSNNAKKCNLDAAKSVACCAPCCSTVMEPYTFACCLCFLPLIFNPVEHKSVKYQWTDNARKENKRLSENKCLSAANCAEICCSRVMSPEACVCIFSFWWLLRESYKEECPWCISCPCLFPFWITYGVCLCCEDHLCRKVCDHYKRI